MRRSSRGRGKGEAAKGGVGKPVNCCTMARKLEVSVVRTVVGARRDALDRFLDPRGAAAERSACNTGGGCSDDGLADADDRMPSVVVQVEYDDIEDGGIPAGHVESNSGGGRGKEAR